MWQFDALDLRPVVRWLEARHVAAPAGPAPVAIPRPGVQGFPVVAFEPGPGCEIRDTYLDTADWRFHRAGLAVRIRSQNNEHVASLRGLSVDANGSNHPVEIESPLASGDIQDLLQAQGMGRGMGPRSVWTGAAGLSLQPQGLPSSLHGAHGRPAGRGSGPG